jgi:hypothetical protein
MSPETSTEESRKAEFRKLCEAIGFAMMTWQDIEAAHFRLFLKMLGAPKKEVCSAIYYSVESFDARHKMVGRMAHYFMQADSYAPHRAVWSGVDGGLSKKVKDANENRNKLAHYGMDFDVIGQTERPDGSRVVELSNPRLQPYYENQVSRLLGRTPDRPEHNLSAKEISGYASLFQRVGAEIDDFQKSLTLPPPHQGIGLLAGLLPYLGSGEIPNPSPETPLPPAD